MRYFLAVLLSWAIAAPAALALPIAGPHSLSKAAPLVEIAKKSRPPAQRQSRGGANSGGIHPLVGGGDY